MGEMINCLENIEISKIYSRRDKKSKQPIIREGTENATFPNHQAQMVSQVFQMFKEQRNPTVRLSAGAANSNELPQENKITPTLRPDRAKGRPPSSCMNMDVKAVTKISS